MKFSPCWLLKKKMLVGIVFISALNRVILSAAPAFSESPEQVHKSASIYAASNPGELLPDGNNSGCEYEPENFSIEKEDGSCSTVLSVIGGVVAGHYGGKALDWVDKQVSDYFNDSHKQGDGSNAFREAANNSGDASQGHGASARLQNSLWVPETSFDPK